MQSNLTEVNFNSTEFLAWAKKLGVTPEFLLTVSQPILAVYLAKFLYDVDAKDSNAVQAASEPAARATWEAIMTFINYTIKNVGKIAA